MSCRSQIQKSSFDSVLSKSKVLSYKISVKEFIDKISCEDSRNVMYQKTFLSDDQNTLIHYCNEVLFFFDIKTKKRIKEISLSTILGEYRNKAHFLYFFPKENNLNIVVHFTTDEYADIVFISVKNYLQDHTISTTKYETYLDYGEIDLLNLSLRSDTLQMSNLNNATVFILTSDTSTTTYGYFDSESNRTYEGKKIKPYFVKEVSNTIDTIYLDKRFFDSLIFVVNSDRLYVLDYQKKKIDLFPSNVFYADNPVHADTSINVSFDKYILLKTFKDGIYWIRNDTMHVISSNL
jgi:hypothetical protein